MPRSPRRSVAPTPSDRPSEEPGSRSETVAGPDSRRRFWNSRLLILAPILAFVALACWAFASPVGSSPDDDFHLSSIWCAGGTQAGVCEPGPTNTERYVPDAFVGSPCFAGKPTESASCQSGAELHTASLTLTDRGSFTNNYPPIYYATMHLFVGPDITTSVLVMRLVNALLFVGISTILWLLLPRALRPTLVWGWLITMVPLGMFLVASNNPSSWAIMGVGASWLSLYAFFGAVGRRKWALGVLYVVTLVMAAGSRGDAAVYAVIGSAVVVFLTARWERRYLLGLILPVLAAVVALVFFLSTQQANVAINGLQPGGIPSGTPPSAESVLEGNLPNVQALWIGVFGFWGLGWIDTPLPVVVWIAAAGAFAVIAFSGLSSLTWRKLVSVLGLAAVLWLLPTYVLQQSLSGVGDQVQPRYLLPLIVLFAGVTLLPTGARRWSLNPAQLSIVLAALAVSEAIALNYNIRRYVSGTGNGGWNLNHNVQWWWNSPISPMALWVIGVLAFAATLVTLLPQLTKIGRAGELRAASESLAL